MHYQIDRTGIKRNEFLADLPKKLFSKQQGRQLGESVVYRQIFVDGGT